MSLERELEAARDAALAHAQDGEQVAAVMAAEPGRAARVYLIAFQRSQQQHSYLALDGALAPIADRRLVRDAIVMLGLAERAEEASIAIHAERLDAPFAEAQQVLQEAGREPQAAAAGDVRAGLAALLSAASGPRVATPAYLDALGAASGRLAVALLGYGDLAELLSDPAAGDPPPEAETAWRALAAVAAVGDPTEFSQAMTSATAAIEALADDVLERLRAV